VLNKYLTLIRPLAVMDLETTGLNPEVDRVIQIGLTIHYPDRDPIAWASYVNPETPILNKQHGISDADVADHPPFRDMAPRLVTHLIDVDIAGYNVTFDIGFMKAEMKRAGVDWPWNGHIIDALQIYKIKRGHTLTNAYLEFGGEDGNPLPPGSEFEGAHDAGKDVAATEIVLRGQLLRFSNLPRTVKELADFCFPHPENAIDKTGKFIWVGGDAAFNFGKWRGKLLKNPEVRGYLKWIATVGEFPEEVKNIAQDALDGNFPVKS
jgi:DNA polymerase-3 subunit epsilon